MTIQGGPKRRILAAVGLVLLLDAAGVSAGTSPTCGMSIGLDYLSGPRVAAPGDVVRVRLAVGGGAIVDGTSVTVRALRYFLGCNAGAARLLPCVEDGVAVVYGGDSTLTTTCAGVVWRTGHGASGRPNQVTFTPDPPLVVPANTPDFCSVEFDVEVVGPSRDTTPALVEQVAGLGFNRRDADCDNGLRATVGTTGGLRVLPGR
jgi:hypothetical protein